MSAPLGNNSTTNKAATISLIALLSIALIFTYAVSNSATAQLQNKGGGSGNGGGQKKCNNVKIMAVITGLDTSDGVVTLQGSATLQGQTVQKTITVNTTDESHEDGVGLPLFFKKAFQPCPQLGTPYNGQVNGTTFSGVLTSISRPNVVEVDFAGHSTNAAAKLSSSTNIAPQVSQEHQQPQKPMILGQPAETNS